MYDNQHILSATAPLAPAVLPSTGGEVVTQVAIALAFGMLVWGLVYVGTQKSADRA